MTGPKWKVGDEIVVKQPTYNRSPGAVDKAVITKVARKYFYATTQGKYPQEQIFEIDGGREKPHVKGYTNYLAKAYVPAEWEEKNRRDELLDKLREHGVRWSDSYLVNKTFREQNFTTDRLRQLLVLVECVAADQPTDRL